MLNFFSTLQGGDRRSIGRADAVVRALLRDPSRFDELWDCLANGDSVVRMRAADALEKFSRKDSSLFANRRRELLAQNCDDGTAEVRWHLIAITSRLKLTAREAREFCAYLRDLMAKDRSRIVKVMALQAAFELRSRHPRLAREFQQMLEFASSSPWPSLRARAAKLGRAMNPRSRVPGMVQEKIRFLRAERARITQARLSYPGHPKARHPTK